MKKKLLSLMAMALVAIGMNAQTWTAPVAPSFEGVEYVADGTTAYYLYNVECGNFVTGANSWATQISLGTQGAYMELVVEPMSEIDEEEYPGAVKLKLNGTFYFTGGNDRKDYAVSNTYLFRDSETSGFIDHASQAVWYWRFEKAESGNYYWHSIAGNDIFPSADEQYARGTAPGDPIVFNATIEDKGIEWKFIPVENYDANAQAVYMARVDLYNQAKLIADEELEAYGVSYEDYTAVYNGSDVEAIKAATEELAAKVVEARKTKAFATGTEEKPTDVTFLLTNPKFSGSADGWTVDVPGAQNKGYQGANYTNDLEDAGENAGVTINGFIEAWVPGKGLGDGKIYQTVELPMGKYVLGVDVIATNQYTDGDAKEEATGFQLYALGGGIDNGVDVSSYNGKPEHYEFEFITAGGTTELGMRMIDAKGNWFGCDNFTVFYKGSDIDPYYFALPPLVEECEKINLDEVYANSEVREAFEKALETAQEENAKIDSGEEEGEFEAAYKALTEAKAALEASIEDYKKLTILVENVAVDAKAYENVESLGELISKLYDQYKGAYEDGTATKEQIEEWITNYDTFIVEAVKAAMPAASEEKPLRINALASNLDYAENSKEPWECSSSAYKVNYHNGEVWQASFSCLQTIKDLPAGKYIIKAKAFYRDATNADHYDNFISGMADITTYLVANENKVQVKALALAAVEDAEAPEGSYYQETTEGSGIWMPNTQQAAEWAFNNTDFFDNEVSTYLATDGDLTFGTRNDEITDANNQWSVWSQFEIYYAGKSQSALYEQVVALTEQASSLYEQADSRVTIIAGEDKLNDAINAGDAAKESDSEEALTAIIAQLTGAMAYISEGQELVKKLTDVYNTYDEKYSNLDFDFKSTDTTFPPLMDGELGEAVASEEFASNEQIQGWIDELPKAWIAYIMGQPAVATASEETPLDITAVLFNPAFESGNTNFWNVDNLGQNNGYQGASYTTEETGVTIEGFVECWRNGAVLDDGAISQTLGAALPEGYYVLHAEGHAVCQMGYPEGGIQGVNLTATDGTNTWATPLGVPEGVSSANPARFSVVFKSNGKNPVTVGIFVKETNANWIAFDNFSLAYLGTAEPVAVEGIAADETATQKTIAIYNLAGQRVQKAVRGLYIINGKKVVIK